MYHVNGTSFEVPGKSEFVAFERNYELLLGELSSGGSLWELLQSRNNQNLRVQVTKRFRERDGGIPWLAILDSEGTVLTTSDGPDGNVGFPSEPASIDYLIGMIKSTMQRMSAQELTTLREALEAQRQQGPGLGTYRNKIQFVSQISCSSSTTSEGSASPWPGK